MTLEPLNDRMRPPAESAVVIVCETDGHWAVAMRREAGNGQPPLRETRSLAECWELLERHAASFAVVEMTRANLDGLLTRLAGLRSRFPRARLAVVADRRLAAAQWLVREAGAVHVVTSPRQVKPLVSMAYRHVVAAASPRRGLAEETWKCLPWSGPT